MELFGAYEKGKPAPVHITVERVPATKLTLTHYRIDDRHSNSYEVWKKWGHPGKSC